MKLKTFLTVYAAAAAVISVNFLFAPAFWITLYGASADGQAVLLFRLVAALFGGLSVMAWTGRDTPPSPAREAMVRGLLVTNALATLTAVGGALSGVYNRFMIMSPPVRMKAPTRLCPSLVVRPFAAASRNPGSSGAGEANGA